VKESTLLAAIRQAVNADGRARLVRNSVGFDTEARVRYGLGIGSPDLVGVLIPTGRAIGLEVKTSSGRVRPEQVAWIAAFRRAGGFACVVRSVDDALAAIDRAHAGATE
jgi:hypothetical protein